MSQERSNTPMDDGFVLYRECFHDLFRRDANAEETVSPAALQEMVIRLHTRYMQERTLLSERMAVDVTEHIERPLGNWDPNETTEERNARLDKIKEFVDSCNEESSPRAVQSAATALTVEVFRAGDGRVFANVAQNGRQLAHLKVGESYSVPESPPSKPLAFCILNSEGKMHWSEACIFANDADAENELEYLTRDDPDAGWHLAPFYASPVVSSARMALGRCANEGKCECDFPQCQYSGSPCVAPAKGQVSKPLLERIRHELMSDYGYDVTRRDLIAQIDELIGPSDRETPSP